MLYHVVSYCNFLHVFVAARHVSINVNTTFTFPEQMYVHGISNTHDARFDYVKFIVTHSRKCTYTPGGLVDPKPPTGSQV